MEAHIDKEWHGSVIPALCEYIKIPNLSPSFDPDVLTNGLQEKAMQVLVNWVKAQNIPDMEYELISLAGRTPVLFLEFAATNPGSKETVLLYAHMDKQPPFNGWHEGLDPYVPVIKDGKLYGRGGADDGYGMFCAVTAIQALKKAGIPHDRCVVIVEASEESGSPDLPAYISHLQKRIGTPNLVVCLDSGCGNYDQLWLTTSLRGILVGDLTVEVTHEGVHSGDSSGVIPDSFRLLRSILSRLEDENTGEIIPKELYAEISEQRQKQTASVAQVLGRKGMIDCFPFLEGVQPVKTDSKKDQLTELAFNRWLRPQLAVVGVKDIPACEVAGNVLRPKTTFTLSIRLPPSLDANEAEKVVAKVLTSDPPLNAKVTWNSRKGGSGFLSPEVAPWLGESLDKSSKTYFNGNEALYYGEGGSIPFMGMLGKMFPAAQFVITGVLGPNSNAHGPNEFLHIDFSCRLTKCIASVLRDSCIHFKTLESTNTSEPAVKRTKTDKELVQEYGRQPGGQKL